MSDTQYSVFLPDFNYYEQSIRCQFACPVRTDARGYVNAIARGDYEDAYIIARATNPFASTCGYVCGAPCEAACQRGNIDAPVAIRALKRFVNEQYGVHFPTENGSETRIGATGEDITQNRPLRSPILPNSIAALKDAALKKKDRGHKVAIVGSGPAGLTCAHDLALLGFDVTIFEGTSVAGGMLRMGVPEYRLPREIIDKEIEAILSLGPKIEFNKSLGVDFSVAQLKEEYSAVFLAIGTYQSRALNIEGEQLDGVLRAIDFLINVNLGDYSLDLGEKVIVIGGGNVAMDVARTAARLGHPKQSGGDIDMAIDVARTAARLGKTREVHCLVVEGRDEMLADAFEVEEAEVEGIIIHNHVAPKRILGSQGRAKGLETVRVIQAFDEQGRFNPSLDMDDTHEWEADSVIVAIGQKGELDWVDEKDGLEMTPSGTLVVDRETLQTTAEGVFAGGDVAFGPRLIINAVADGQRAARSIYAFLTDTEPSLRRRGYFTPINKKSYKDKGPARDFMKTTRVIPPTLPANRRIGVATVEKPYRSQVAKEQGQRCFICSTTPVFNGALCILCNGCVDVCPTNCLKLVSMDEVALSERDSELVFRRLNEGTAFSGMLFDPQYCIRCGLCAERCPTEAVRMESFEFFEEITYQPVKGLS